MFRAYLHFLDAGSGATLHRSWFLPVCAQPWVYIPSISAPNSYRGRHLFNMLLWDVIVVSRTFSCGEIVSWQLSLTHDALPLADRAFHLIVLCCPVALVFFRYKILECA